MSLLLLIGAAMAAPAAPPVKIPDQPELTQQIEKADAELFTLFFEGPCDIPRFRAMITDDIEFYHDKGGFKGKGGKPFKKWGKGPDAKLKKGGEFRFGTDHPVYLRHALMVMQRHRDSFRWLAEAPNDFLTRPGGWPETRYEAKARTVYGHEVWYFRYRRL